MPRKTVTQASQEWSYMVDAHEVTVDPISLSIEADEEEKLNLSRRFGILSLESLKADLTLWRVQGGAVIQAEGRLMADLTQQCVITLRPVTAHIEENFEAWFADKGQTVNFISARKDREARKPHAEIEIMSENEDPEPIVNGKIDLGELTAQYLALAINPYPHAEEAHYDDTDGMHKDRDQSSLRRNPFEALKNWKERR